MQPQQDLPACDLSVDGTVLRGPAPHPPGAGVLEGPMGQRDTGGSGRTSSSGDTSLSAAKREKEGAVFCKAVFIPLKRSFYCEVVVLIFLC